MQEFDVYQFILCLVVFTILTVLFSVMLGLLVKNAIRIIKAGLDDDKIKKEYLENKDKKPSIIGKIFDRLLLAVCCVALFSAFGISMSVSAACNGEKIVGRLPKPNVVRSESMSYIAEKHKFLKQGEVTDQLQMFDLVFITEIPKEEDLKVNDIVVYEIRGNFIIHRIVAIEEPNSNHPNERHFLLQGDANEVADRFPVLYSQMKGIYNGTRIPFIGSFVLFMQSPGGWLCVLLVIVAIIATPIIEKKLQKEQYKRLTIINQKTTLEMAKEFDVSEVFKRVDEYSYTDEADIKTRSIYPIHDNGSIDVEQEEIKLDIIKGNKK